MNRKEVFFNLKEINLNPLKSLGQNFLIDNTIRNFIIDQAQILKNDIILEIGPGLGALTERLVEKAKKVYAIEIDPRLCKFLKHRFFNKENLEIINDDILNINIPDHNKVVSNLPYTITGPIFEKVFFKKNPPHGILTIEKSIAERIFFKNNYKNFSRITISVNSFMIPVKKFKISKNSFYPMPTIDLSLIILSPRITINNFLIENETRSFYLNFLGGIMPYKNKNLVNALELYLKKKLNLDLNKKDIKSILNENNINNNKIYRFDIEEFVKICKIFYEKIKIEE